jgi:hypothetical protein
MQAGVEFSTGATDLAVEGVELDGEGVRLSFTHEGGLLQFRGDGIACNLPFTVSSDWELVREELAIQGRDATFEAVLPGAIALAGG